MVTEQQHEQTKWPHRHVKPWKIGIGCSAALLCIILGWAGLYLFGFGEDLDHFSRCFMKYPPSGAENRFRTIARDVAAISAQDTLLAEPKPPELENRCGCGFGWQIQAYGSNQSYDEVLAMFRQAMVTRKWEFEYSLNNLDKDNKPVRYDNYGDTSNTAELTVARTDPNVGNLWLFWSDGPQYFYATATVDPSKPWGRFKTHYLVALSYAEPNMRWCFPG